MWGADHARCADLVAPRLAPVLGDDVNEHADTDELLVWVSVHITEAICEEVAPQSIRDRFSGAVPFLYAADKAFGIHALGEWMVQRAAW